MPAVTRPGPVPALTIACSAAASRFAKARWTMRTSAGDASPAPAELTTADIANIPGSGAAAMPAAPPPAVTIAATTSSRGRSCPIRNPTRAAAPYTSDPAAEMRPAVAVETPRSALISGRWRPKARRTSP